MLKRLTILLPLLLAVCVTTAQAKPEYVSEITLERGEKWWGIFVCAGPMQPFSEPFSINTAEIRTAGFYTPVMLSSNGRFIWSANPIEIEFNGQSIKIGSDFENVKVVKAGKTLREAYIVCTHRNYPPNGTVPDVALFTMPIYELEVELGYAQGEQEVIAYAKRILEEGLPPGVIVIPDGWRSVNAEYRFATELYPDPKALVDSLHAIGFKAMLTITPYIPATGKKYVTELANDHLLREKDGAVKVFATIDDCRVACYDISDDTQFAIVADGLKELKDVAVFDGYRFDCRKAMEFIPPDKRDLFMTNWLKLGEDITMCEYIPGENKQTTHYLNCIGVGAEYGSDYMSTIINDMISMGLAGYPYGSVAGFADNRSIFTQNQTTMAAMLQLSMAMPVAKIGIAPWRIKDAGLFTAVKDAICMRAQMATYIKELLEESTRTAEPLLRHMEYQLPKMGFADCNDQFMLGPKYLFAPNISGDAKRMVRLPKGVWYDSRGRRFKGPLVTEVDCSDGGAVWFELGGWSDSRGRRLKRSLVTEVDHSDGGAVWFELEDR